ncbi:MAG: hypothetical protein RBS36_04240 [Thiomicrospira sp.]|jgi:hypothetical protein|nr:hypothetical protein [Thiomicrospira sp.]
MNAIALDLSHRTENLISRLSLQAVNAEPRATTTRPGALNACECCGILAQLSHSRFRHVFMIIAGIANEQTYTRLAWEVSGYLHQFGWAQNLDQANTDQVTKLAHVINFAICQLAGQQTKTARKAAAMGITTRSYNDTWRTREDDIYRLLIQWAHDADYEINRLLK